MRIAVLLIAVLAMVQLEGAIKREFSRLGRYRNVRIIKVSWKGIHFTHSSGGGVLKPEDLSDSEKEMLSGELESWRRKLAKHNKENKHIVKQIKHEKEAELKDLIDKISSLSFDRLNRWFEQKINVGLYDGGFSDAFAQNYSIADNYKEALNALNLVRGDFEDSLLESIWAECRDKSIEEVIDILYQRVELDITDYDFKQNFYNRFPRAELKNDFFNYLENRVFKEASELAIGNLNKAIKKGKVDAMAKFASLYAAGHGVRKDLPNAQEWYMLAAKKGSIDACYALGVLSANGTIVENSAKDGINWFLRAAEQNHAGALFVLGNCYLNGFAVNQDYAKAVEYYTRSANEDFAPAQWALGICYLCGIGVQDNENNEEMALEYLQKAADNKYVPAEFVLGYWMNFTGDAEQSKRWFSKVKKHNFSMTDFLKSLGKLGPEQDFRKGDLLQISAEKGNPYAQFIMWVFLSTDFGNGRNIDEADKWFKKAAENDFWLSFF